MISAPAEKYISNQKREMKFQVIFFVEVQHFMMTLITLL